MDEIATRTRLDERLRLLRRESAGAIADILRAAIRHAEPAERRPLAEALVRTGDPRGIAAVIRLPGPVDPAVARLLRGHEPALAAAVGRIIAEGHRDSTLKAIGVVRCVGDHRMARLLVDLLESADGEVSRRADEALLALVLRVLGLHGTHRPPAVAAADLDTALAGAARRFGAHRAELTPLAIAVAARRPGSRLAAVLADPDQPIRVAMGRLHARADHRAVAGNLLDWLAVPGLTRAAVRGLATLDGVDEFNEMLRRSHLLLRPHRRRTLAVMDRPQSCLPRPEDVGRLARSVQAGLPRYLQALRLQAPVRLSILARLLDASSRDVRALALHALAVERGQEASRLIARTVGHDDGSLAHAASVHLAAGVGPADQDLAQRLEHSGHEALAARGRAIRARHTVEAFRSRWLLLPQADRLAAARCLWRQDPEGLIEELQRCVRTGREADRLAALVLVRRLGLADRLLPSILVEVRGPDVRVVSAAVAALGAGRPGRVDSGVEPALQAALAHVDARVRANAIEALRRVVGTAGPDLLERMTDMARQDDNRPRADAVRWVIDREPALGLELLQPMLLEVRPLHRISAIWVAARARVRAGPVMSCLSRLAEDDPHGVIRERADRAVRFLNHTMHESPPADRDRRRAVQLECDQ